MTFAAARTPGIARARLEATNGAVPKIERPNTRIKDAGSEPFECVGDLDGGDGGGDGAKDAGRFAGWLGSAGRLRIHASKTGMIAGQYRHGQSVTADGSPVDPGDFVADGVIVDQIAGFEVIGTVEDEDGLAEQIVDIGGCKI